MPMYTVINDVNTPSTNVMAIQMLSVKPRTIATMDVTSRMDRELSREVRSHAERN